MKRLFLLLFTWWSGTTIGTLLYTRLKGELVGEDEFGNRYYRNGARRWVIYTDVADASLVPPSWHAWLHHRTDTLPSDEHYRERDWQQPAQPNLTGTAMAYRPKGSILTPESRPRVTGDYEPWSP